MKNISIIYFIREKCHENLPGKMYYPFSIKPCFPHFIQITHYNEQKLIRKLSQKLFPIRPSEKFFFQHMHVQYTRGYVLLKLLSCGQNCKCNSRPPTSGYKHKQYDGFTSGESSVPSKKGGKGAGYRPTSTPSTNIFGYHKRNSHQLIAIRCLSTKSPLKMNFSKRGMEGKYTLRLQTRVLMPCILISPIPLISQN